MNSELKLIKLINEIDKIMDNYFLIDDLAFSDDSVLNSFSYFLSDLFKEGITKEELSNISKLEKKEIFKINYNDTYNNNEIRRQIEEYINENDKLYFNYNIIKENIKENYRLSNYIKEKDKKLDLVDYNELVMLLLEVEYLKKELILKEMKKSNFLSLVFLGVFGDDNNIYKYSDYYLNDAEINMLLFQQLEEILKKDCSLYIGASKLVKKNKQIRSLVIKIDKRMKSYMR